MIDSKHIISAGAGLASRRLLAIACVVELATGLALLLFPRIVIDLLFGDIAIASGVVVARIGGISLIALGVACWPAASARALAGMVAYGGLVTLYLVYLGIAGVWSGVLLWPAAVGHLVLTTLLVRAWRHDHGWGNS